MTTATQHPEILTPVTPAAYQALQAGDTHPWLLLDVREPGEYAAVHIPGSRLAPLAQLDAEIAHLDKHRPVAVLCQSGNRAQQACKKLRAAGFTAACVLEGGLTAWQKAGLTVSGAQSRGWSIMRQVQFTAGLLILTGVSLSLTVHPWFWGIPAFVGAGLTFAGLTGTCGMARLLMWMPWNR